MWQMNLGETMELGPYPERVGEPDCSYYMRTGMCRFGMTCKFNHPADRKLVKSILLPFFQALEYIILLCLQNINCLLCGLYLIQFHMVLISEAYRMGSQFQLCMLHTGVLIEPTWKLLYYPTDPKKENVSTRVV